MRPLLGILLLVYGLAGCSWDYPVWTKSKQSDTELFRFVVNERYGAGYIDREGRVVIPPQFLTFKNRGGEFFEGQAQVTTKDDRSFYIDRTGKRVAKAENFSSGDFSEGLATFWDSASRKTGFVDHSHNVAIPPKFERANSFRGGLAAVEVSGGWGFVDKKGEFVIPAHLGFADDFADGRAVVIVDGPCQYTRYGPCEYLANPPYTVPGKIPEFFAKLAFLLPRCRYSVIDKTGKILFTGPFIDAMHFSEGLAPMGDGTKWGFVDPNGRVQIPLQFEAAAPFSEGLARVRVGGKWGYIDHGGKWVIQPRLVSAGDFSEGMAVVGDTMYKYWFLGRNGERAIPGEFDAASGFVMGLAHVRTGVDYYSAKWSYIDRTGKAVFTYSDESKRGTVKK